MLARRDGQSPIWMIPTARGPAAVALEHEGLLDREDVMLEDQHFPGAAEHVERVVKFLRAHRHEALPRYFDDWIARDRTVHQFSARSGWDAPVFHLLTGRSLGGSGFRYLQGHRSRGEGLPPAVALRIIERLADVCRLAHAEGVVHGGILLDHSLRVQPNGRPVLACWAMGRRAVGNVGCDFEGLWYGTRDLLGGEVPSPLPAGDVFALGSALAMLVTGGPAYVRGPAGRHEYRPPSARGPTFAWLDELVGLACDPSRGFTLGAGGLARRLAAQLEELRPARECVLADLEAGDFRSLAAHVACSPAPGVGGLADAVCEAVQRHLLAALTLQRCLPLFSELPLAACPEALPIVRAYARDPANAPWSREIAGRLLAIVGDPEALGIGLELGGWAPPLGWSVRPELVDAGGAPCRHPWTSLGGEPSPGEPAALQRECRQCGPVRSARAWLEARRRSDPPPPIEMPALPTLVVITGAGTYERALWPGGLGGLGSEAGEMLSIAGLDPADHAGISAIDAYCVGFTFGVFGLPFRDGSELRTCVLDTRRIGASLTIGPLRFEASAPGQVTVRAPAGVPLQVAASMRRTD